MAQEKFDVFLSHSSADKGIVTEIAEKLRRAGIRLWMDSSDIRGGEQFLEKIETGLRESAACAIFFGPHESSRWVQLEIEMAQVLNSRDPNFLVIPVFLPGLPEDFDLRLALRTRDRIDFRGGIDDPQEWQSFVNALKRPLPPSSLPGGPPVISDTNGGKAPMYESQTTLPSTDATMALLRDNLRTVQSRVKDLTFTPVIGVGCSLIGRSHSEAWARIADRMEGVLAILASEEKPSKYLRSLAGVPAYGISLTAQPPSDAAVSPTEPLVRLQVALARLGAALSELFASAMLESVMPVWDTMTFKLPIAHDDPRLDTLFVLLADACVAAYELKSTPEERDPATRLGAAGMYDRLMEHAGEVLTRQRLSEIARDHAEDGHRANYLNVADEIERRSHYHIGRFTSDFELSLHELEWIADALWHTFRYHETAYPRVDELAFQISLVTNGARSNRPDLGMAAELGRVVLSTDILTAWYQQFGKNPTPQMHEFYDVLARILRAQLENFKSRTSRSAIDADSDRAIRPVAFSTNYDLEMEAALQRTSNLSTFHVFIPVNAYVEKPGESHQETEWLFGTVHKGEPIERPDWEWWPPGRKLRPREIRGPIIIKLHGSPLHELPNPDDLRGADDSNFVMPEYERFEHALILSEREFLQKIVWKDDLLQFFDTMLKEENRAWFFLGHSIREWSTRLRFFSSVYRRNAPPSTSRKIAINRSHDPYRSAVLSAIGIERWTGDLEEIIPAVDGVLS